MGCSPSAVFQFSICICDIFPLENNKQIQLRQTYKEVFTMLEKMNVIYYMEQSSHEEFTKFFKNKKLLKECIFYFVFDDKTSCVAEFEDATAFIPKDEYSYYRKANSAMILKNVFIFPTTQFEVLNISKKYFYRQIEKLQDPRDAIINLPKEIQAVKKESVFEIKEEEPYKEGSSFHSDNSEVKDSVIELADNHNKDIVNTVESILNLTDYDSDSANSLEDEDPNLCEEIICKDIIKEEDLSKARDILSNEEVSGLVTLSIVHNKFNDKEGLINLEKLLELTSSIPHSLSNEVNNEAKPKMTNPIYLRIFNFNDNQVNSNIINEAWLAVNSFIQTKRTFKKIKTPNNKLKERNQLTLRTLNLSMNNINDLNIKSIIKSMRHVRLHKLDFSGNFLGKRGFFDLSHWLLKNKSLKELYLQNNKPDVDSVIELLKSLKHHQYIRLLNLSYIQIVESGKYLADLFSIYFKDIPSKSRLKVLKLRDCGLSHSDLVILYEGISAKTSCLEELDISSNNKEGREETAKLLIGYISNCTSLSTLYMENNKITYYNHLVDELSKKSFNKNFLNFISINDTSINYFSILTSLIGDISSINKNLERKDVELVISNESKSLTKEEQNLKNEFDGHKSKIKLNF